LLMIVSGNATALTW